MQTDRIEGVMIKHAADTSFANSMQDTAKTMDLLIDLLLFDQRAGITPITHQTMVDYTSDICSLSRMYTGL